MSFAAMFSDMGEYSRLALHAIVSIIDQAYKVILVPIAYTLVRSIEITLF